MTPEEVADYARWRPSYKSKGVSNTAANIERRRLYGIRKQEYLEEYRAKLIHKGGGTFLGQTESGSRLPHTM